MRTKRPTGVIPDRILLLLDCFGALGAKHSYGQSALAEETNLSPQIIRRRAADARMGRVCRGMPIDQVKQICQIAVREIEPLRGVCPQELAAWCIGLDKLHTMTPRVPKIREWMKGIDPRCTQ